MDIRNIRTIISQNIHHWRMARRFPEETVAMHLGITLKRLKQYENGNDSPTCDELIAMATLFCCSVNDLCLETP